MNWLIAALMSLTLLLNTPLLTNTTVKGGLMSVEIVLEANPNNADVTVAVTALDTPPVEWVGPTVSHVWYVDTIDYHFIDRWPNMRTGHFRVQVTLHRDGEPSIVAPAVDVEVQ